MRSLAPHLQWQADSMWAQLGEIDFLSFLSFSCCKGLGLHAWAEEFLAESPAHVELSARNVVEWAFMS
eukprot:5620680-Amphidinium_carterae.1